MKKVVLIDLQGQHLAVSPARYQLLEALNDNGYETYIVLPSNNLKRRKSFPYIHHVIHTDGMTTSDIRKRIISINPEAVIASYYGDMKVVYVLPFIMKNTSFYYYNLEIYTPYINKDVKKENLRRYLLYKAKYPVKKLQEIIYTRNVKLLTIQDDLRRRLSAKYHIQHKNTLLIPNSYTFDSDVVIDSLGTGVVYSGGVKRDFLVCQFENLKKVRNIPVTFLGPMDKWCRDRIKGLKKTNPNITFCEQELSPNKYTDYLRRFAVGLVWYSPVKEDEVHYYMGLSSGKMFKHLSLGQPIIAVECPGITAEVKKHKLGVVIKDISELEDAYSEIIQHYAYYQNNVITAYKQQYDFKYAIKPFLDCIEKDINGMHK